MEFTKKVKDATQRGTICDVVFECLASVAMNKQGLFEHQDRTGNYCFIPSTFYCPLKYYVGDLKIDPALCKAQELRYELSGKKHK